MLLSDCVLKLLKKFTWMVAKLLTKSGLKLMKKNSHTQKKDHLDPVQKNADGKKFLQKKQSESLEIIHTNACKLKSFNL